MDLKQLLITLVALVFVHTGFGMSNNSGFESDKTFKLYHLINQVDEEKEINWELPENRELEGHAFQSTHPFEFNTPSTKTAISPIINQDATILGNRNKQFHLSVVIGNCGPPPDFK
ncbi:MAG: hypothetical protein MH132_04090 [Hydrotalea sp.]|nr:hypothetical protein [Hydrotalea sp.]